MPLDSNTFLGRADLRREHSLRRDRGILTNQEGRIVIDLTGDADDEDFRSLPNLSPRHRAEARAAAAVKAESPDTGDRPTDLEPGNLLGSDQAVSLIENPRRDSLGLVPRAPGTAPGVSSTEVPGASEEGGLFMEGNGYEEDAETISRGVIEITKAEDSPGPFDSIPAAPQPNERTVQEPQTEPLKDDGKARVILEQMRDDLIVQRRASGLTSRETQKLSRLERLIYEAKRLEEDDEQGPSLRRRQRERPHSGEDNAPDQGGDSDGEGRGKKRRRTEDAEVEWQGPRRSLRLRHAMSGDGCQFEHDERLAAIFNMFKPSKESYAGLLERANDTKLLKALMKQMPRGCDTRRKSSQEDDIQRAADALGRHSLSSVNGVWRIAGMKSNLEGYQLQLVSWMVQRERAGMTPSGGIIADDPGTGKTVMSLACMAANPATAEDLETSNGATLIVVPGKEVAEQWKSEIRKHCGGELSHLVRLHLSKGGESLADYDGRGIVITTYGALKSQFPPRSTVEELLAFEDGDSQVFQEKMWAKMGDLFFVNWYRIILDESHAIKNMRSAAALSCCCLKAKHYWTLSGTPLSNSIREVYAQLTFIGYPLTTYPHQFSGIYQTRDTDAMISLTMFRRLMSDTFIDKKLVDLPRTHCSDLWIPLSEVELLVYRTLETHYDRAHGEYVQAKLKRREVVALEEEDDMQDLDEADDPYEDVLPRNAKMIRLRQVVSHVFNVEKIFRSEVLLEDIAELKETLWDATQGTSVLDEIQEGTRHTNDIEKYERGLEVLRSTMGPLFQSDRLIINLMKLAENEQVANETECQLCKEKRPPIEPVKSDNCDHMFCMACMLRAFGRSGSSRPKCPYAGCDYELTTGDDVETLRCVETRAKEDGGFRDLGKDFNKVGLARKGEKNGWSIKCQTQPGGLNFPPAVKVTAAMAVILTWAKEAPRDKIIVFTNFVGTGSVLGALLNKARVPFVYLYGPMSDKQKAQNLESFTANDRVRILVSSIHCGGQSLNLAVANRVILIDPHFNKTVEKQALGRVVRRGQTKETHLIRIFAEDTYDERIHEIQEEKFVKLQKVLQDDGHVPEKLDQEDRRLALLPGPTRPNEGDEQD